ncbi:polysaccharide biosynthesis/export family protein [Succinimonas amylolytica]|uniref:polysaccharide biosynthesis/export family protein n=1 Tax=Succinimonas amylolytica TaxID=83769 RepID=UPI00146146C9|nr:polysaccharide biosynthesis/export family protein [Succinimonas amylolytica]
MFYGAMCTPVFAANSVDLPQSISKIGERPSVATTDSNVIGSANKGLPEFADPNYNPFNPDGTSKPAWAQGAYQTVEFNKLKPFGYELFQGNFANTFQTDINPNYRVSPGDRIVVKMWGAKQYEDVLTVDIQGNIFIPEIGPVYVQGCSYSSLGGTIKSAIGRVFTSNVELYVNLQSSQPVAVFVTGAVNNPGRYAGSQNDNILSYIDRAGGINSQTGSYREILIKRKGGIVKRIDLYRFITQGELPELILENNDVILVNNKQIAVSAYGLIKKPASYEFLKDSCTGSDLLALSGVEANVTHVQVSGIVNGKNFNRYLSLEDFRNYRFHPDDRVMFVSDSQNNTLVASVIGPITGKSRYIVAKGTHLKEVLANISVDPAVADTGSVYVKRKSVAEQQKIIINDALKRLEQAALTAESGSVDEANIRVKEAELIQDFVKRAQSVQPDGIIVVSSNGRVRDLLLEDEDQIVIPQKSNVIQIGGEVLMPKAVVYDENYTVLDYINETGGFSERADEDNILIVHPNGQVARAKDLAIVPGSRIIVMPEVDSKSMQFAKDVMQVIYQIAVATKIAVGL